MEQYFCPHCGATLNEQEGFDPSGGTWLCECCGTFLMDDDVYEGENYEGIAWFCDECGALLNRQDGFTDDRGVWVCTACGYENSISEDDIVEISKPD